MTNTYTVEEYFTAISILTDLGLAIPLDLFMAAASAGVEFQEFDPEDIENGAYGNLNVAHMEDDEFSEIEGLLN